MTPHTKIGCEAYIVRDGQLLLGKRGHVHGQGTWALPGGHLEFLERANAGLMRELREELGVETDPSDLKLLALTDDVDASSGTHYVHITFAVELGSQEPRLMEYEACDGWKWYPLDALPANIYPPHAKILATIASGHTYVSN